MDKIWYRNPSKSEVIGRCVGDEKTEWPHRTDNSRTQKNLKKWAYIMCLIIENVLVLLRITSPALRKQKKKRLET